MKLFYRISIGISIILILITVLVQTALWFSAAKNSDNEQGYKYRLRIFKDTRYEKARYSSASNAEIFDQVSHLLTPAFLIIFAVIAVKLTQIPEIFEIKD